MTTRQTDNTQNFMYIRNTEVASATFTCTGTCWKSEFTFVGASSQVTGSLINSGGNTKVSRSSNCQVKIPLKRSMKVMSDPFSSKQTILQSRSKVLEDPRWPTILAFRHQERHAF